jgi:hypothetical protein
MSSSRGADALLRFANACATPGPPSKCGLGNIETRGKVALIEESTEMREVGFNISIYLDPSSAAQSGK